ncbi:MAG: hypothetical protein ACRDNH_07850 [Gaiellaceae bacterium]
MKLLLSVLAAALAVAAGAGCSEDENGARGTTTEPAATKTTPPPAPPPPTEPINAWARKADAVCRRYQRQIEAVPPPTNEAQTRRALRRALVPIRKQERALKRLGPPEDNRAIGLAFIGSIVSTRRALEQVVAGLAADDEAVVQRGYMNAGAAGARTRRYAQQLGLVSCGAPRGS